MSTTAENRRVARYSLSEGLVRYVYAGGWRVLEEQHTGGLTRQYVDGDGIDEHLQIVNYPSEGAPTPYYYHCNDQGFVGALTDASGDVAEYYEYSWLGVLTLLDGSGNPTAPGVGNRYAFQGRRLDLETGFYHFRHRSYDPRLGEFLSQDPAGMWTHGQGNGYSAFGGDPWNYGDPFGLDNKTFKEIFSGDGSLLEKAIETQVEFTKGVAEGVGDAVVFVGERVYKNVGRPLGVIRTNIEDVETVLTLARHPGAAWSSVKQSFTNTVSSPRGWGYMTPEIVGTAVLPALGSRGGVQGAREAQNAARQAEKLAKELADAAKEAAEKAAKEAAEKAAKEAAERAARVGAPKVPKSPGTRRNPDGSIKNPADQVDEIEKAQRRNPCAIESTKKSKQNLKKALDQYNPEDWDA